MPNVRAYLNIALYDDMSLGLDGCIDNKFLAYSLLELARDGVKDRADEAAKHIKEPTAAERLALLGKHIT